MNDEVPPQNQDAGTPSAPPREHWERALLERLAMATLNEQRRARRWRVFFTLLGFLYVGVFLWLAAKPSLPTTGGSFTAVVEVEGLIAAGQPADAKHVIAGLRRAFEAEGARAVLLRINSPGGSPVQAGQIYDEILRLRGEHPDIPVYAVIEDVGASGAYYVAAAAQRIYADKASVVGSIGVRLDGFGFVEAIDKLGIERRLFTAGRYKGMGDPFLPLEPEVKAHVQGLLEEVHRQFVRAVKAQRADRLAADPSLFTGLVWTGERAVALGLVDALGSLDQVAREVVGEETLRDFTVTEPWIERLSRRLSEQLAAALHARFAGRLDATL